MAESIFALCEDHCSRTNASKHLCIMSSARRHVLHSVALIRCMLMNDVDYSLIELHRFETSESTNGGGDAFACRYFRNELSNFTFSLLQNVLISVSNIKCHRCSSRNDIDQTRMNIDFPNRANLVAAITQSQIVEELCNLGNHHDRIFAQSHWSCSCMVALSCDG